MKAVKGRENKDKKHNRKQQNDNFKSNHISNSIKCRWFK